MTRISGAIMLDYRGDFEVHLTVQPASDAEFRSFQDWCDTRNCKCVFIVLARGDHPEQPMATWRRSGTALPLVVAEANQAAAELDRAAITVVRVKIEANPFNEDVPVEDAEAAPLPGDNYFEHHIKLLRDPAAGSEPLLQTALEHGAHLSRNAWRRLSQEREERFVTLRCHQVGRNSSDRLLEKLLAALRNAGEQIIETESEYSVYDTNVPLDRGWLP